MVVAKDYADSFDREDVPTNDYFTGPIVPPMDFATSLSTFSGPIVANKYADVFDSKDVPINETFTGSIVSPMNFATSLTTSTGPVVANKYADVFDNKDVPINETFTGSVVVLVNIELATTIEVACDIMRHDDNEQDSAINDAARSVILPAEVSDSEDVPSPNNFIQKNVRSEGARRLAERLKLQLQKKAQEQRTPLIHGLLEDAVAVSRLAAGAGCSVDEAINVLTEEIQNLDISDTDEDMPVLIPIPSAIGEDEQYDDDYTTTDSEYEEAEAFLYEHDEFGDYFSRFP